VLLDFASRLIMEENREEENAPEKKRKLKHPLWERVQDNGKEKNCACLCCNEPLGFVYGEHLDRLRKHYELDSNFRRVSSEKGKKPCKKNPYPIELESLAGDNNRIKNYFPPIPTAAEQESFNKKFARWFYTSGMAFSKGRHQDLQEAITAIRPGILIPSEYFLSNTGLNSDYSELHREVDAIVATAENVTLVSDGWSDINRISLIAYNVIVEGTAFFYRGKYDGKSHTGMYLADELNHLIQIVGEQRIAAVCTDSASNNKKGWKILKQKYKNIEFFGCICHVLHNLVKDLMKNKCAKELDEKVRDVVKYFKSHHREAFMLEKWRKEHGAESLKLPATTRWGYVLSCFKSFRSNREGMRVISCRSDFIKDKDKPEVKARKENIKKVLADEEIDRLVKEMIAVLTPIVEEIVKFQSDKKVISDCFQTFIELKQKMNKLNSDGYIGGPTTEFIQTAINNRWNHGFADIHGISYLLDPRYFGKDMDERNREQTEKYLKTLDCFKVNNQSKFSAEQILYTAFCNKYVTDEVRQFFKSGEITVKNWIEGIPKHQSDLFPNLHKYLKRIFSIVPSSASCERTFSSFSFIHTKSRNRLKRDRVKKLVYIFANRKAVEKFRKENGNTEVQAEQGNSDDESDWSDESVVNYEEVDAEFNEIVDSENEED
jgi:hypothetical protein